jgi:CRISPR-associated protein (TIGR03986 family)
MTIVKSPYNFVPAPTEAQVFTPDWADKVSHDVPFEDGESGEIEIEITAETPIFIRNGHTKPEDNEKPTAEFSHYIDSNGQKQYFIPATSLKGMFRNVLEIMSFSRLNKDLINDHRYAFRDLSSSTNQYMTRYKEFKIKGGWLKEDNDGSWKIEKCEDIAHIDQNELLENFGIPFRKEFLNRQPVQKDAKYKYEHANVRKSGLQHTFSTYKEKLFGNVDIILAKYDSTGKRGTLVFTGQPGKRVEPEARKASGKIREFVFFNDPNPKFLNVNEDQQKDFKFIYGHDDPNNLSSDWKYWRDKLKKGEKIPVFFSEDNSGDLQHFGLSYMYKLPFKYKISQLNPLKSYTEGRDLAETLFGFAEKEEASKGRVMFGHALAEKSSVKELKTVDAILGGPKASYFPYYLTQFQKDGKYYTYDDLNAVLRGFKRYPVKNKEEKSLIGDNTKVVSHFNPLDKGAKFKLKVRFHNLKQAEIGALLSSITFHGYSDQFYHSLGAAKPLGYGKVNVMVKDLKFLKKTAQEYMLDFETLMTSNNPDWLHSPQINELFATAKGGVNEDFLQYPSVQEYADYKKRRVNNINKDLDKLDSFTETFKLQNLSKNLKPFALRLKPQNLQVSDFDNYPDLAKYLNEEISVFGEFTEINKQSILDKLIEIIESEHKDSLKKLKKSAHWSGNISRWLGEELKTKLQNKYGLGLED